MKRPAKSLEELFDRPLDPTDVAERMAHFRPRVERNKTRRRRDGDPPAAMPHPAIPRGGGGLSGGAAAPIPRPRVRVDAVAL